MRAKLSHHFPSSSTHRIIKCFIRRWFFLSNFPNGPEEISLLEFISKYQYLDVKDSKYFFNTQKYYKKRIRLQRYYYFRLWCNWGNNYAWIFCKRERSSKKCYKCRCWHWYDVRYICKQFKRFMYRNRSFSKETVF